MAAIARAFVAVEPPDAVREAISERVQALDRAGHGSWLRLSSTWHVTLQFLGRVEDVDPLVATLARALQGATGPVVQLGGGGAFPRARHGTVLWLGFERGADELTALATTVALATESVGFAGESRRFRPHVTLARTNRARDLRRLVDAIGAAPVGPPWPVEAVSLVSSETRADGPRYTEIERFALAPAR
ncbi:MAG TPA: RNA 2',3'-cyclic phosphodiesterase [Acidimicrobiia bacterium]